MIKFSNVCLEYTDTISALNNVSLNIDQGEFVFMIGKSGAGKTSLIKLLSRELKPTTGRIWFAGRDISRIRKYNLARYRRNFGIIFQDYKLLKNKTAYENIAYALEVTGAKGSDIREKTAAALQLVSLEDRKNSYPSELSGGEQQRIAIARAFINFPSVIIADEPTGNLDKENAQVVMNVLEKINKRGITVIVSTHDRGLVNSMKKRVIALKNGSIIYDENPGEYIDDI
jgi:cell division ATP-binding protein ftsE